jgi:hypothetical protein
MTAATGRVFGIKALNDHSPFQWSSEVALAANVAPYRDWLLGLNRSTGYAVVQAAGVTNLISVGRARWDQAANTVAGAAKIVADSQTVSGYVNSSAGGDALAATDYGRVAWAVDNQTVGKLSNSGGVNRSMAGLFLGLDADNRSGAVVPVVAVGPEGWTLARAAHMADGGTGGHYLKATDAGAKTDIAETCLARAPLHGHVTGIDFLSDAALSKTTGGVYKKLLVYKRDGAGGAAVLLGTLDTSVADIVAFAANAFVLSSTAADLDVLETDILTVTEAHDSGTGAIIPSGAIRVTLQVG